ncbi:MAG: deoxynucleoside kinase [Flavobacteriales bacterium]
MKNNFIVIEGNIGSGKTTLAKMIAEKHDAKLVLEKFEENPFLPKFYEAPEKYAFPLEMSFLAERFQQLNEKLLSRDLFKQLTVADYYVFKSLIFSEITLTEDEYKLYRKFFHIMYSDLIKPDLYVYLYQTTDRLLENIQKRGRRYEQNINRNYLDKINKSYMKYIKEHTYLNILILDVSNIDFVKNFTVKEKIISKIFASINNNYTFVKILD